MESGNEARFTPNEPILGSGLIHLVYTGRHGDSLATVASQQLREKALWPGDKDPFIEITDVQYCLLEVSVHVHVHLLVILFYKDARIYSVCGYVCVRLCVCV